MHRNRHISRQGLTLLELLIAVFIVLLITGIAIPVMTPTVMERRQRETSRLITSYLAGARTRAIQTGRPFGVTIEPQGGLTAASVSLSYAEVYAPWAGDTLGSGAHIISTAAMTVPANPSVGRPARFHGRLDFFINTAGLPVGQPVVESGWRELIRPGDLIRFNYNGHYYLVSSGDPWYDDDNDGVRDTGEWADVIPPTGYTAPNLNSAQQRNEGG
jgi:prepilin-type N-terminal cleavage/methylation domain-containing protein